MMNRKLTTDEVKELLAYIEGKGFKYRDVQLEIFDHLACKVEEILEKNPDLSLSDAIERAHVTFGIFGLSSIEDSYRAALGIQFFKVFPKQWLYIMKSWKGFIFVMIYLAFAGLLLNTTSINFIDGMRIGFGVSFLIMTIAILLKYRPLSKNYLIYRSLGMQLTLTFNLLFQLMISIWLWNWIGYNWGKILMLIIAFLFMSVFMVYERRLKQIVEQIDDMELKNKYS